MSATNEESSPNNPLDALYALSRRPTERPDPPRLAAISDAPAFPRAPKLEPRVDQRPEPLRSLTSPGDRLESAMSEFVRRQIKPEAVPVPAELRRDGTRRTLIAGVVGVAAAVVIASVVALLFVTVYPREKDPIQSFAAAAAAAARQADDASKAAPSEYRGLITPEGGGQGFTHEQSERLLQQFVQWRQKAALIDKP
jgi:hypothetical protein